MHGNKNGPIAPFVYKYEKFVNPYYKQAKTA
jgi:hypothetical protein